MRSKFDEQLALLHKELVTMGALCESAIALSAQALDEGNSDKAVEVFDYAVQIDRKERDIETMCMRLLLQQQPVAKDLRVISSALKMVTDMERIGDNSGDIAEIVTMGHIKAAHDKLHIHDMAQATIKMVTDSIDAFVNNDVALAHAVIEYDDVVDGHFDRIKTALITLLRSHDADGEYALDLLMTAKYLERMGDHAVNIAEWVLFSITGQK
ncbi:MAG TPA: phosphate signaling complex protein PhoU [Candidatus Avidehalobacter gallistercoris]|uniref:Phosphate-specific transport system accessory protein PhoU n=1 Tax=Candidatus Avidehalobacter gallistercoris TaxID=2840694 RepID=A0A9D1HN34_9FIRM|nr:phosphate signaling complex protein PhoU [Candidatus Avidehalobacter gallistercoris]